MDREIYTKCMDIITKKEKSDEDAKFFRQHASGFGNVMLNIATHELVTNYNFDIEDAKAMLLPLVEVYKIIGATEFVDFAQVADMFEKEGLK